MSNQMLKHTKLELFGYCDGCEELSPKVTVEKTVSVLDDETEVRVTCKNAHKCENMRKHILATIEEDN